MWTIHELDLRDETSIKSCASAIIKESEHIAGLVNSAGIAHGQSGSHDPNDGYARRF